MCVFVLFDFLAAFLKVDASLSRHSLLWLPGDHTLLASFLPPPLSSSSVAGIKGWNDYPRAWHLVLDSSPPILSPGLSVKPVVLNITSML